MAPTSRIRFECPVYPRYITLICLALLALPQWELAPAFGQNRTFGTRTVRLWEPVEWSLANSSYDGNPFDLAAKVMFVHAESGEQRNTEMFYDGDSTWRFRFTATRPGRWSLLSASDDPDLAGHSGMVVVHPNPAGVGFVSHVREKWVRQVGSEPEPRPFVPQLVMYGGPQTFFGRPEKLDQDIDTFLTGHGFNGFHVPVFCRWFDLDHAASTQIAGSDPSPDRRTFEALETLINKTRAAGGTVHLWAWGDESRQQTPKRWGINGRGDRRLQRYIAARLGPLPGWTMGYGFDLWEWVRGDQLTEWHDYLHSHFGWPHMLGARASKNRLNQLSEDLDYSSYEQHRPDFDKYVETIRRRPFKPSFSEDRFRIRQSARYRGKDYDAAQTRRGLWHSTMAGGVANIWGNLSGDAAGANHGARASAVYPKPEEIKTYAEFFRGRFLLDMKTDRATTDGSCLRQPDHTRSLFYQEETNALQFNLTQMPEAARAVAIDTRRPYREIDLGTLRPIEQTWQAPYISDWAIAVGDFPHRDRPPRELATVPDR